MVEDAGIPIDSRLRILPQGFGLIDLKLGDRKSELLLGAKLWNLLL